MNSRTTQHLLIQSLLLIVLLSSCSTKKNRWVNRQYHNTTAKYNGYFNGKESIKKGLNKINENSEEDYSQIITVFKEKDLSASKSAHSYMDKAIRKGSVVIQRHSMKIKGKEYCKWIDDNYLMIGKAYFYKGEFDEALKTFLFIVDEFKKTEIAYEAKIFALRTYSEKNDFLACEGVITELNKKRTLNKKTKLLKHSSIADCYLKQQNYSLATDELKECIKLSNKKQASRFKYILAQVYQKVGNQKNAHELFDDVIRESSDYEMTFNAKMNLAKSAIQTGINVTKSKEALKKMLKDDKNKEYLDQIYFTISEIEIAEMDTIACINSLLNSTRYSLENDVQKSLSFYNLAKIYYSKQEYRKAGLYYDSTIFYIDKNDEKYAEIFETSQSLNKLINNLDIVYLQDSLIALSTLPKNIQLEVVNEIINNIIEKEKKAKEQKMLMEQSMYENNRYGSREQFGSKTSGGKWYFYNPSTLSFGLSEFRKKWGKRKLEDDWRRSDKGVLNELGEDTTLTSSQLNELKELSDKKNPNYYLSKIPKSEKEVVASNKKIKEALYQVAIIYRDYFDDYKKSNATFYEIFRRYNSDTIYVPLAYYNLYINHVNQEKKSLAFKTKEIILSNYPKSKYAKILADSIYVSGTEKQRAKDEEYYSMLKDNFLKNNHKEVVRLTANVKTQTLIDKEIFLRALSMYRLGDTALAITEINKIISNKDLDQKKREEYAEVLKNIENPEIIQESNYLAVNKSPYKLNLLNDHMLVFVMPKENSDMNYLMSVFSDFNKKEFSTQSIEVSSLMMGLDQHILIIKTHMDYKGSLNYELKALADKGVMKEMLKLNFEKILISKDNFSDFYKDKDLQGYKDFYNKNYPAI